MLVRSSLWQTPLDHFDMAPSQYRAVMEIGDMQCVTGMVADCLKSNSMGLTKKCVIHLLQLENSLALTNQRLNRGVIKLSKLLNSHGIRYAVVKGQTLGIYYPKPEFRTPGDIDFYVGKEDVPRAIEVIGKEWGLSIAHKKFGLKHICFDYEFNTYELHKSLLALTTNSNLRYMERLTEEDPLSYITIDGEDKIATLSPTLNVFYTFCHFFHHLRIEGVAYRQLCDWALMMHHCKDEIDTNKLLEILKKTNYLKAYKAFGSIVINKLGLPKEDFPFPITAKDEKWGAIILKDIQDYGNWGEYGNSVGDKKIMKNKIKFWAKGVRRFLKYAPLSPREMTIFITCTMPMLLVDWVRRRLS